MIDEDAIRQRWEGVGSKLDERGRRLFAAGEEATPNINCIMWVVWLTLGRSCNSTRDGMHHPLC